MRLRSYVLLATVSFTFQVGIWGVAADHLAHAATLTPQQLEEFKAELHRVEEGRNALTSRADCLETFVAEQQRLISERELALGEAMKRQNAAETQVAQSQQEFQGHQILLQQETANLASKAAVFETARRERQEQAERLNTCNQVLFFLPGICQAGEDAVKGLGWMNDAEAEFRAAEPRLREAQNGFNEVQARLDNSTRQLAEAQQSYQQISDVVTQTASTVAQAKKATSEINEKIQAFSLVAENFSGTLNEAADLDLDDVRLRTIERLIAEGRSLTSTMPDFIEANQSGLPEEARRTCSH